MVTRSTCSAKLDETALPDAAARMDAVEKAIGFPFRNRSLLLQALLHRSAVIERQRDGDPEITLPSNERLEFLGDAILSMLIAHYAFEQFPESDEGQLTEIRAALVRRSTLAILAESINLGTYLYMGRSERKSGGRGRNTVLAEGLEALVAAIFLDRGLDAAGEFVASMLRDRVSEFMNRAGTLNAKSRLQEFAQTHLKLIPAYSMVGSSGPAHDTRFSVAVTAGQYAAVGSGTSKRGAEQDAARTLLEEMQPVVEDGAAASDKLNALRRDPLAAHD
jgi:ribonuclease-3